MTHQSGRIVNIQLLHEVSAMGVDSPEAKKQCFRNLAVCAAHCDVLEYFRFTLGQARGLRTGLPFIAVLFLSPFEESVNNQAGHAGTEEPLAVSYRFDRIEDLPFPCVF